jgi:hypothetical protein
VGSQEGAKCGPISRRGGVVEADAVRTGGGGGSGPSGFRRKKTTDRLTGRAHLLGRRRWWGRLSQKGGGREVGHSWAERGMERVVPRLGQKPEMAG